MWRARGRYPDPTLLTAIVGIHSYFSLFLSCLNVFTQHRRSLELPECRFLQLEQQLFAIVRIRV